MSSVPVPSTLSLDVSNAKPRMFHYIDTYLPVINRIVSSEDIERMNRMSLENARRKLAELLKLNAEWITKDAVLLDFYFGGYWWARDVLQLPYKIETFLAVTTFLLKNMKEFRLNQQENLKELKKVITAAVEFCDGHTECELTLAEAKYVTEYIMIDFFQHYRLYECYFRRERPHAEILQQLEIETIEASMEPFPQPLAVAMSHSKYLMKVDPIYPNVYVASHRKKEKSKSYLLSKIHGL